MSLFQSKTWWRTQCGHSEEFDAKHFCPFTFNQNQLFVVGSYEGIYKPQKGEYQPNQLIYEQNFKEPILQIMQGRFSHFTYENCLAVLFLKSVQVFEFLPETQTIKANYINNLPRNGFSMVSVSPNQGNKDLICIQSCDGELLMYEFNNLQTQCTIPDFTLPSCMVYLKSSESILIQNSGMTLESYTCKQMNQNLNKTLTIDRELSLSQEIIEMYPIQLKTKDLLIFYTKSEIFQVDLQLHIKKQKKIDYEIITGYCKDYQQQIQILIGTTQQLILIYMDFDLVWALYHDIPFINIQVLNSGFISFLNENGHLGIIYLGMNLIDVGQNLQKNDDNQNQNQNLQQIINEIKAKENNNQQPQLQLNNEQIIQVQCEFSIEFENLGEDRFQQTEDGTVKCVLAINMKSAGLQYASLQIQCPQHIFLEQSHLDWDDFQSEQTVVLNLYFYRNIIPETNIITLNILTSLDQKNYYSQIFEEILPAKSYIQIVKPTKEAQYKLTFDYPHSIPPFSEIFSDIIEFQQDCEEFIQLPNIISLQLLDFPACSIIQAKTSNRVRIQSQSLSIIAPFLNIFNQRIKSTPKTEDPIPLDYFFIVVDNYYDLINKYKSVYEQLNKQSELFRAIQKKLLNRFKEKKVAELSIETILNNCFQAIINMSEDLELYQQQFKECQQEFSVILEFIKQHQIMRGKPPLDDHFLFQQDTIDQEIKWVDQIVAIMKNSPVQQNLDPMEFKNLFQKQILQ